jgi:hypothetical protein
MSWARAFNGHLADQHRFLFAHIVGRIAASTPISPDIGEQIEARLAPFMWKAILDTRPRRAEVRRPGSVGRPQGSSFFTATLGLSRRIGRE